MNLSDLNVMVVDDDEFSRKMLVRILHKLKVEKIREAVDGHQALIDLRVLGHVDCMFLDFEMPTLNGLEVLKSIRDGSASVDRSTNIAMLTAHNNLRLARTAIALDVSAFLNKPAAAAVIKDRLLRVVATVHEIKAADIYAAVVLPTRRVAAVSAMVQAPEPPSPPPEPAWRFEKPPSLDMLMKLEIVPPNTRITRSVLGPDGAELLPAGTVLSQRLLTHLYDLRELDSCVAELWVERTSMTVLSHSAAQS